MINRIIKVLLTLLFLAGAVYEFTQGNIGNGIFLIVLALIFVGLYLRHEYMLLALFQLRKKNTEKAKKLLLKIRQPEKALIRSQVAYYYFLRGITEAEANINLCERYMYRALDMGLRMKHDKALAHLNLSMISLRKRQKRKSITHLDKAKKFDTAKMLTEQIRMVRLNIKRV